MANRERTALGALSALLAFATGAYALRVASGQRSGTPSAAPGTTPGRGFTPPATVAASRRLVLRVPTERFDPLRPPPAGYYGIRWRESRPPGWPEGIGTYPRSSFRSLFYQAVALMTPAARAEMDNLGYSVDVAEQAVRVAIPTLYRLALHESSGQFYRPADNFDDRPIELRGGGPRISASGAWQFNEAATSVLAQGLSINGTPVHGPLIPESHAARGAHHGSVLAQIAPVIHYILVAAWAIQNGRDPVQAIWAMHTGATQFRNWVNTGTPPNVTDTPLMMRTEPAIIERYLDTGDPDLLDLPYANQPG